MIVYLHRLLYAIKSDLNVKFSIYYYFHELYDFAPRFSAIFLCENTEYFYKTYLINYTINNHKSTNGIRTPLVTIRKPISIHKLFSNAYNIVLVFFPLNANLLAFPSVLRRTLCRKFMNFQLTWKQEKNHLIANLCFLLSGQSYSTAHWSAFVFMLQWKQILMVVTESKHNISNAATMIRSNVVILWYNAFI